MRKGFLIFLIIFILFTSSCENPFLDYAIGFITVKFETNGGSSIQDQKLFPGEKVKRPGKPSKMNFSFDNWYEYNIDYYFNYYDDYNYNRYNYTCVFHNTDLRNHYYYENSFNDGFFDDCKIEITDSYIDDYYKTLWDFNTTLEKSKTLYAAWKDKIILLNNSSNIMSFFITDDQTDLKPQSHSIVIFNVSDEPTGDLYLNFNSGGNNFNFVDSKDNFINSINPGEKIVKTFNFVPKANLPFGKYNGTIEINNNKDISYHILDAQVDRYDSSYVSLQNDLVEIPEFIKIGGTVVSGYSSSYWYGYWYSIDNTTLFTNCKFINNRLFIPRQPFSNEFRVRIDLNNLVNISDMKNLTITYQVDGKDNSAYYGHVELKSKGGFYNYYNGYNGYDDLYYWSNSWDGKSPINIDITHFTYYISDWYGQTQEYTGELNIDDLEYMTVSFYVQEGVKEVTITGIAFN